MAEQTSLVPTVLLEQLLATLEEAKDARHSLDREHWHQQMEAVNWQIVAELVR